MIAPTGEVVSVHQLNNMRANKDSNEKRQDLEALRRFIAKHRPSVIGIGAGTLDARRLYQDIQLYATTIVGF